MRRDEQEKRKKKIERFKVSLANDYGDTFSTPHGQRVLNDILSRGYFFNTTFTGNSATFRNEGKRELVLHILNALLESKPELISNAFGTKKDIRELFNKQE